MDLALLVAIAGGIILLAIIVYGFRQGMKVTTKQDGDGNSGAGFGGP